MAFWTLAVRLSTLGGSHRFWGFPVKATVVLTFLVFLVTLLPVGVQANPTHGRSLQWQPGEDLVGNVRHVHSRYEDTFADIGEVYNLGFLEMVRANPDIDPWLPGDGTIITLPTRHILPSSAPREDIVINLAEFRLYHFKDGRVTTYPVGIGNSNNPSPLTDTEITMRLEQPAWYPPESIRNAYAERGESLPRMIPPGPENPLGPFALQLAEAGYLIHGTNRRFGIGQQVSHGCIRMYNDDIRRLVWEVERGTEVRIIDEPVKATIHDDEIWIQVHGQDEELTDEHRDALWEQTQIALTRMALKHTELELNRARLEEAVEAADGIPVRIGEKLPTAQAVHWRLHHEPMPTLDDDA